MDIKDISFDIRAAIDIAKAGNEDELVYIISKVHREVCDCDDRRCTHWSEIYTWLYDGDYDQRQYTLAELVAEWRDYERGYTS